jgi:hypothetical protein
MNPIEELLSAPLEAGWTLEGLAARVLDAVATSDDAEWVLDAQSLTNRQARRLIRPLLACLATQSAVEAGTPVNLFTGHLNFKRHGPSGPVWFTGEFDNRPGSERIALRRHNAPPDVGNVNGVQSIDRDARIGAGTRPT